MHISSDIFLLLLSLILIQANNNINTDILCDEEIVK
jgi:hypothetical protein